jgi:uncharacterized membrane protein
MTNRLQPVSLSYRWAGLCLGFGLGGFFDGILLHQILQWHHLLSGLEGEGFRDIRVQILADGLFHLLMYLIAVAGLWLLWRGRARLSNSHSGKDLISYAMIGFGTWHVLDGILSHWLLGVHRIKMGSDIPLFWDVLWLFVFGFLPIIAGWSLHRGHGRFGNGGTAAGLAALVVLGGAAGFVPPSGPSAVVVVFRPSVEPSEAMAGISSIGGKLIWTDASDQVWTIELEEPMQAAALYLRGALFVSSAGLPAACFRWTAV